MTMQSSRRPFRFGLLLAAALASAPLPAYGLDGPQDRAEAQRLYAEGKKLRKDGKHADALDRFRRAHDLMPTPVTRLDLARALDTQNRLVEAHALLVTVGAMPISPTETQKGKLAREEAKILADAIAPRIPKVRLVVTPGAGEPEVAVDGRSVSKELLGGDISLDPGDHTVTVQLGERIVERAVTLAESERLTVELTLPAPEPAPEIEPPAPTPPPRTEPVRPAVQPAPRPVPIATTRGLSPVVPVAFTLGGLGIATGIITGAIATAQAGTLKDECRDGRCPPEYHSLLSTHKALGTTSTVAFALGGAGAAAGAVAWIVGAPTKPKVPSTSSVQIRWMGTGVAVEGTW